MAGVALLRKATPATIVTPALFAALVLGAGAGQGHGGAAWSGGSGGREVGLVVVGLVVLH